MTLLVLGSVAAAGCGAPPSVTPLLRITDAALEQESQQIDAQGRRDKAYFNQARQALADAFDADLKQQDALSAQWVREAVAGYVPAREQLARREAQQARQRHQRKNNLAAARAAQQRAIQLLEQQDQLVVQGVGVNLWRELRGSE